MPSSRRRLCAPSLGSGLSIPNINSREKTQGFHIPPPLFPHEDIEGLGSVLCYTSKWIQTRFTACLLLLTWSPTWKNTSCQLLTLQSQRLPYPSNRLQNTRRASLRSFTGQPHSSDGKDGNTEEGCWMKKVWKGWTVVIELPFLNSSWNLPTS